MTAADRLTQQRVSQIRARGEPAGQTRGGDLVVADGVRVEETGGADDRPRAVASMRRMSSYTVRPTVRAMKGSSTFRKKKVSPGAGTSKSRVEVTQTRRRTPCSVMARVMWVMPSEYTVTGFRP
jgi:hypothetical protein